ncbi:unnamed protein product [Pylaiella littoralis]
MGKKWCNLIEVAVVVLSATVITTSDAFLSGASPGPPRSKASQPGLDEGDKPTPTADGTGTGPSPVIETIAVGIPQHSSPFAESELTAAQARAIALEAAISKTVPKVTALEALHCLTRSVETGLSTGSAPMPMESIDGVWRLCFCDGELLQGIEVDKHGYLSRSQDVHVLFDAEGERIVLGSRGLDFVPPMAVQGGLAYAPETQTVIGTFEKESAGIEVLVLQACLIDQDALGFHTITEDKQHGFLLFHAEKGEAARARLSHASSVVSPAVNGATSEMPTAAAAAKAETARVASEQLLELKREMVLRSGEEVHENKRLAVQETGRNTGSFDTFIRYLETEGPSIYAVIAGPVIFRFMARYSLVASTKAAAAALVMVETAKHILTANV